MDLVPEKYRNLAQLILSWQRNVRTNQFSSRFNAVRGDLFHRDWKATIVCPGSTEPWQRLSTKDGPSTASFSTPSSRRSYQRPALHFPEAGSCDPRPVGRDIGYGRLIEIVDRVRMTKHMDPKIRAMQAAGALSLRGIDNLIAATSEGYPFPCNLDIDSPLSGMAPGYSRAKGQPLSGGRVAAITGALAPHDGGQRAKGKEWASEHPPLVASTTGAHERDKDFLDVLGATCTCGRMASS
jgi:hypothetical protein